MNQWTRRIPFKVDIAGIIEIMGTSLYSRATTPIRELIQNAHDAIMRRRQFDLRYTGRIDLQTDAAAGTITFKDDGIGLSESEAEQYLGTLGVGITGILKRAVQGEPTEAQAASRGEVRGTGQGLIGQFGIGLFSGFMIADRMVVYTRRIDGAEGVRWDAGPGTDIELSSADVSSPGTSVTLYLKPGYRVLAENPAALEEAVKEYADFLPIPIFLNDGARRSNLISAAWFEPTPEREAIELELESFFGETALDVMPIRVEEPVSIGGALYVTPQRTPGFSGESVVTVTVRRMVISRQVRGLMPHWASFLRGVLELNDCAPTASREDLVRNSDFEAAKQTIERLLYEHLERLARTDPQRLSAIINWHRYAVAGAALSNPRLRALLRGSYPFLTSRGPMSFDEVRQRSPADPLVESEAGSVIWYNSDRRQERWASELFAAQDAPCVNAIRSFEESLLAAMAGDVAVKDDDAGGAGSADGSSGRGAVEIRPANPSAPNFTQSILGASEAIDAEPQWQDFLDSLGARVMCASFDDRLPALAFLNEKHELMQTFEDLKKRGDVPAGFQRLIDNHFDADRPAGNQVLLNTSHPLIARALSQKTSHPLASVLRLLVTNALSSAGATLPPAARKDQEHDLDWIAQTLWVRGGTT